MPRTYACLDHSHLTLTVIYVVERVNVACEATLQAPVLTLLSIRIMQNRCKYMSAYLEIFPRVYHNLVLISEKILIPKVKLKVQ